MEKAVIGCGIGLVVVAILTFYVVRACRSLANDYEHKLARRDRRIQPTVSTDYSGTLLGRTAQPSGPASRTYDATLEALKLLDDPVSMN